MLTDYEVGKMRPRRRVNGVIILEILGKDKGPAANALASRIRDLFADIPRECMLIGA